MKSNEFITEAPLPADWDTTVFSKGNAIKKQVDYVLANSQRIGAGTSRIVTTIDYQGRSTALKIAKNRKGLAQNAAEVAILSDGYVKNMGLVIPIIDWDKENNDPVWLQTELAQKTNEKQLCQLLHCISLSQLVIAAEIMIGKRPDKDDRRKTGFEREVAARYGEDALDDYYEVVSELATLADSFDLHLGDLARAVNWGLYKGQPVIIDYGFTESVYSTHYS